MYCVINGIVERVFEVEKWQETDTKGRYEFVGREAPQDIKEQFINKRIPQKYRTKGNANPVLYSK